MLNQFNFQIMPSINMMDATLIYEISVLSMVDNTLSGTITMIDACNQEVLQHYETVSII